MIDAAFVARAREAAALVAPHAERTERDRRLPPEALAAIVDAGVMKVFVPAAYGGAEASVATGAAAIEAIASGDGSAGWCAMIGATSALMSGFLDDAVAREVFASPRAVTCGVFAPMGRARRVEGGYRVSGRWPFASGCEHADFRMGGALVEGDPPLAGGAPDVRSLLFRADQTTIVDTWRTSGLCGTGSHDLVVDDAFVPDAWSFSFFSQAPRFSTGAFATPFFGALAATVASVGLGVARAAIDAFVALATQKRPQGSRRTVADRETVQLEVARAEARLRAARAGLHDAIAGVELGATVARRAHLRASACHAATEAAVVVDRMYEAAGASAIFDASPLQRHFRDAHVVTQHFMVAAPAAALAGRALLGLPVSAQEL